MGEGREGDSGLLWLVFHLPPASVLALTVQGGKPRPPILLLLFPRSFSSLSCLSLLLFRVCPVTPPSIFSRLLESFAQCASAQSSFRLLHPFSSQN